MENLVRKYLGNRVVNNLRSKTAAENVENRLKAAGFLHPAAKLTTESMIYSLGTQIRHKHASLRQILEGLENLRDLENG